MSDGLMLNVPDYFNTSQFCQNVAQLYQQKGFVVNVAMFNPYSAQIVFNKNVGGINTILGLGLGITANITVNNNMLCVSFTDAEWTGKIIGLVIGWFLCLIPFITAIIGVIKQSELPKQITNDMTIITANILNNTNNANNANYY